MTQLTSGINVQNVVNVKISAAKKLTTDGGHSFYTTDFVVKNNRGELVELTIFHEHANIIEFGE